MQDDITWGVQHLIAQGTADPKRIGILAAPTAATPLAGVATPDLYRAAVDIVDHQSQPYSKPSCPYGRPDAN